MSDYFNGWSFDSDKMRSKVKYIVVMRGDLDLTNAYGLESDESLSEFLRDEADCGSDRLYAIFEVARVVTPNNRGEPE